jgi:Pvc16 N-terminal domain
MLDELDETIRKLLTEEMPIRNGEVEVTFEQPNRTNAGKWKKPAVNLFLYDLRENNVLRQHQIEQLAGNGKNGAEAPGDPARLKRTPYRVDCYYMLTTWANDPETEHRLMSRCLLTLFRRPVLPKDYLVGSLKNQPFELQAHLASHDRLTNPAEVWASLDNEMRPTVSYIITLALDPWKEEEAPLVHTLTLIYEQATELQVEVTRAEPGRISSQPLSEQVTAGRLVEGMDPGARDREIHLIGGTARSRDHGNVALAGINVAIKGTRLVAITDKYGRFTLGSLPAGEYTLLAWRGEGEPVEREISIPARKGNYDILVLWEEAGQEEAGVETAG